MRKLKNSWRNHRPPAAANSFGASLAVPHSCFARCQGFTLKQTRRNRRGKLGTKVEDSPGQPACGAWLRYRCWFQHCSRLYVLTSFCSPLCRKAKEPGKATTQSSDCIQIVLFVQDLYGSRLQPSRQELKFLLENLCTNSTPRPLLETR